MLEFEVREESIDGVEGWLWPKCDTGLWHGPKEDWKNSHKQKILKYCKKYGVVVQAGGGCGMYPRLLSNIFDVVYTFEPVDTSFYFLVHNCMDRKIVKLNAALGPTPGLVSTTSGDPNMINLGMYRVEERCNSYIPRMTIDSIPLRACDLIMLDVEGYESEALKGAMETMHKFNPVLFIEQGEYRVDWLKNLGYEIIDQSVADTVYARERTENI